MSFEFDVMEIPLQPPIGTLIDAGVNLGQFAREALPWFCPQRYVGFEILHDLVHLLRADPMFCSPCRHRQILHSALGETVGGRVPVGRTIWHPSSSLLTVNPQAEKWYGYDMTQTPNGMVNMTTLDYFCGAVGISDIDLLKIDVQGYEGRVLRGGLRMLKRTRCVVIEILKCQHYFEQSTSEEIDQLLVSAGLHFHHWLRKHPSVGEMLEGDALYVRDSQVLV